ncbi:MAG TPA: hypothetical protein VMT17_10865 [Anaeromyxobacteraceae bacterium]|nr:hypothetical protein [Anaeromyxobacteraceae bacterium]
MASIRASQLKEDIAALAWLGPAARKAVLAKVAPATVCQIEESSRVDWLPHALVVEIVHAIRAVAGEEAVRGWSRAAVNGSLQGSLFRPFLEGVIAVFGLSPSAGCKVLPRAYSAALKDCGALRLLEVSSCEARMVLEELPAEAQDRDWLVSVAGGFEVIFDACKVKGRVELEFAGPGSDPRFHARWE